MLLFFVAEYRQTFVKQEQASERLTSLRRGLFVLVALMVYLAVTVLQISIERFLAFYNFHSMKFKLLLWLLVSSALTVCAESITIRHKGGNETVMELESHPVITFSGENMTVTNDYTTLMIPIGDIEGYVVNNTSGIHQITDGPRYADRHILYNHMKEGASASVCTIDGKIVSQQKANAAGIIDIDLSSLPKGIYIIKSPMGNIKVINK